MIYNWFVNHENFIIYIFLHIKISNSAQLCSWFTNTTKDNTEFWHKEKLFNSLSSSFFFNLSAYRYTRVTYQPYGRIVSWFPCTCPCNDNNRRNEVDWLEGWETGVWVLRSRRDLSCTFTVALWACYTSCILNFTPRWGNDGDSWRQNDLRAEINYFCITDVITTVEVMTKARMEYLSSPKMIVNMVQSSVHWSSREFTDYIWFVSIFVL